MHQAQLYVTLGYLSYEPRVIDNFVEPSPITSGYPSLVLYLYLVECFRANFLSSEFILLPYLEPLHSFFFIFKFKLYIA